MASNYTTNYELPLWEPQDSFLRTEFNEAYQKIDAALDRAERWVKLHDITTTEDQNPLILDLSAQDLSGYVSLFLTAPLRTTLNSRLYVRLNGVETASYLNQCNEDLAQSNRTELLQFWGDNRDAHLQVWLAGLNCPATIQGLTHSIVGWGFGYGTNNLDICRGRLNTFDPTVTSIELFSVGESVIRTGSRAVLYGLR